MNGGILTLNQQKINAEFAYLENQQQITPQLKQELIKLTSLVYNSSMTIEAFVVEVNRLPKLNFGRKDAQYISVLVQVTNSSNLFWRSTNEGNAPPPALCDLCVIWADAAGAAYGSLLGNAVNLS